MVCRDDMSAAECGGLVDEMLACLFEHAAQDQSLQRTIEGFRERAVALDLIDRDRHYHVAKLVGGSVISEHRFEKRVRCADPNCGWGEKQVMRSSDKVVLSRTPWDPRAPRAPR